MDSQTRSLILPAILPLGGILLLPSAGGQTADNVWQDKNEAAVMAAGALPGGAAAAVRESISRSITCP